MTQYARMSWQGRRLWTSRGRAQASVGLERALEHTLGKAKQIVPLEEGTLERSGRVNMLGQLEGVITFDTVYAVRQLPARRAHMEALAWAPGEVFGATHVDRT